MRILVLLTALVACNSQYMPRSPGRVALTIRDGKQVYVRDGVPHEAGVFGDGLRDAVAGNPAAEAAANEFHSRMVTGFLGLLLGAVGVGSGSAWLGVASANQTQNGGKVDVTGPLVLITAGLVAMTVGSAYFASAETYRWDAINLYNDGAGGNFAPPPAPPPAPPLAPSGPTALAKSSLRMRD
jgi:hypothetical protein